LKLRSNFAARSAKASLREFTFEIQSQKAANQRNIFAREMFFFHYPRSCSIINMGAGFVRSLAINKVLLASALSAGRRGFQRKLGAEREMTPRIRRLAKIYRRTLSQNSHPK